MVFRLHIWVAYRKGGVFPRPRILHKIASRLRFGESEILSCAAYISPEACTTDTKRVDPYVSRLLAREPPEVQGAVLGILSILKLVGKVARAAELPELSEYLRQTYPYLDEDWIIMIQT